MVDATNRFLSKVWHNFIVLLLSLVRILGGRSDCLVYSRHTRPTASQKSIQSATGEAHVIEAIRNWVEHSDANQYRAKCGTPELMMKGGGRARHILLYIY